MTFNSVKKQEISPPNRSKNVLTDVFSFLFSKPKTETKIKFKSAEERISYNQRVMQRIGIDVEKYSILNIHKIGIDAPCMYIFNELMNWDGDSTCWPNHIARVERKNDKINEINILPFGWKKYPFGIKNGILGFHFIPLFRLNVIRIKDNPDSFDFDNARYILYDSSGGYPIGVFGMYVRTSIPELGETTKSQLLFAVSFNFYGKHGKKYRLINKIWEAVHNRVTANVLNRIKQLSEWRLQKVQKKIEYL
jgi:hypothetical protein